MTAWNNGLLTWKERGIWAGENTVLQLIYTVSQTSRWRWLCADVLRKRKAGRNTAHLVEAAERDIARDPAPIGRYNVAPGTKVLLLNERDEQLHLDAVYWGYAPMVG